MALFKKTEENLVKCGKCRTEFDLAKNLEGCPLCGFGSDNYQEKEELVSKNIKSSKELINSNIPNNRQLLYSNFLSIPSEMKLVSGQPIIDEETQTWGSWLMFNDFFAPKFLARVLAWNLDKEKAEHMDLKSLMKNSIELIKKHKLSQLKGFPNLKKDPEGNRLVYHFLFSATKMGLFKVQPFEKKAKDVWKEKWENVKITLTKEGLEFARLSNPLFDENSKNQILSSKEKKWLVDYLKEIDKKGFKEYTVLKQVYEFIKEGNNGNKDLWGWFENNQTFQDYIKVRSEKARKDNEVFKKQLHNYARSFASAKISLLRELGVIKDKRNDYTILEDLK